MSSSSGRHHRGGHYGSGHYQKKSFLGNLFNLIASGSRSGNNHYNRNQNTTYNYPDVSNNIQICTKCKGQIPSGSKFCLECGEKVSRIGFCMDCGETLPPNAKFCMKCGKKVDV